MRWYLIVVAMLMAHVPVVAPLGAATYYVDFDAGADGNAGTSAEAAFKHCPGDPAATDAAKAVALGPGDTVLFKGGVRYRGAITCKASGAQGNLITFDGNTAGTFGRGRAIVDGGAPVTGWKRCISAEQARGNPRWKDIFHADVPTPRSWQSLNLCARDRVLPVAQDPNPSDPMFQEKVAEFHRVDRKMANTFPGKVTFEPGSVGNRATPLIGVIMGSPAVVQPIAGGAFTVELNEPVTVTAVGIKPQPRYTAVKDVAFYGDGKLLLKATLKKDQKDVQRFDLPGPVTVRKLTYKLLSAHEGQKGNWTKIARVAAYTAEGKDVVGQDIATVIKDEKVLTGDEPHHYDGMVVGVHGGNNMVAYRRVERFDPKTHELAIAYFAGRIYDTTRYSFYNSVRLIDRPGEHSIEPTDNVKVSRVFLLPDKLEGGLPAGIARSERSHGFALQGASHVVIRGFRIERQGYSRPSGIDVRQGADIAIRDCEITMVKGGAALNAYRVDGVVVEDCFIHHNPGHTKGIVLRDCTEAVCRRCRLVKNTSTGLDYYGCRGGTVADCIVTEHYGMHANAVTFYLGCKKIVIERNQVYDSNIGLTIQDAEDCVIRNNIFDGGGRSLCVGIWTSVPFRNVRFLNNLFVRAKHPATWEAAVFSNNRGPEGLVFRNNIIDGLAGNLPGKFSHNLYTRWGPNQKDHKLGRGELYEPDLTKLFVDPDKRDYRPKAGSPAIDAGTAVDVPADFRGTVRPQGKGIDIGPYEYKP